MVKKIRRKKQSKGGRVICFFPGLSPLESSDIGLQDFQRYRLHFITFMGGYLMNETTLQKYVTKLARIRKQDQELVLEEFCGLLYDRVLADLEYPSLYFKEKQFANGLSSFKRVLPHEQFVDLQCKLVPFVFALIQKLIRPMFENEAFQQDFQAMLPQTIQMSEPGSDQLQDILEDRFRQPYIISEVAEAIFINRISLYLNSSELASCEQTVKQINNFLEHFFYFQIEREV